VGRDDGIAACQRIEEGRLARVGQADKAHTVHTTDGTSSRRCPDDRSTGAVVRLHNGQLGPAACDGAFDPISVERSDGPPCRRARVRRTRRA
jgi:hypothetical protein